MSGTVKWIVLISGFFSIFLGTSLGYSSGVIHIALLEKYNRSPLLTAWMGSLFTSIFCLAAPFGSLVVNGISSRACVIFGGFLNLIGFTLACFTPSFEFLFLSYGTLAGMGQSFVNIGAVVSIGYYFQGQRTLATGAILVGTGLGTVMFPPLIQLLISYYGLNGAFLILAGISFQTCVFGALMRPHRNELRRQQEASLGVGNKNILSLSRICSSLLEYVSLFTNPALILMCVSILFWSSGINSCTLLLPGYYTFTGSSLLDASYLMSIFGIGSTLSRILTGMAAVEGGIDAKLIYFGSWGIVATLTFCFPIFGKYFTGKVIYSLLLGLYSSGSFVLFSQIAIDIAGLSNFANAVGMELFVTGVGFLIGPIIASRILGMGGYLNVFVFLGCLFVLASILGALMILFIPEDLKKKLTNKVNSSPNQELALPEEEHFIPDPES